METVPQNYVPRLADNSLSLTLALNTVVSATVAAPWPLQLSILVLVVCLVLPTNKISAVAHGVCKYITQLQLLLRTISIGLLWAVTRIRILVLCDTRSRRMQLWKHANLHVNHKGTSMQV